MKNIPSDRLVLLSTVLLSLIEKDNGELNPEPSDHYTVLRLIQDYKPHISIVDLIVEKYISFINAKESFSLVPSHVIFCVLKLAQFTSDNVSCQLDEALSRRNVERVFSIIDSIEKHSG